MRKVYHALMLNLHQPAGNLDDLLANKEWEAREILWALDRMPRSLWDYEDVARVHLSMSGTLLETLSDPTFQQRVYGIAKLGDLLWQLQNKKIFDILGTGYYHPVIPLTPKADWEEQLKRWQGIAQHIFWRTDFQGFWPPEMGFTMEMIPLLKKMGYKYVMVDSEHVEPVDKMSWAELRYRPHIARYDDEEIIVVVRDRDVSNAQESGMDAGWFMQEIHQRTQHCDFAPLVMTATDGDNGGWFRNTNDKGNFWHVFYRELLDWVRRGETEIQPTFIHDYIKEHGVHGEVKVKTGAWNTGLHHGADFMQWTGSQIQKDAYERVAETSDEFHDIAEIAQLQEISDSEFAHEFKEAHWRLLRAETSCHFYWGDAWVPRAHRDLDSAWSHMNRAKEIIAPIVAKIEAAEAKELEDIMAENAAEEATADEPMPKSPEAETSVVEPADSVEAETEPAKS